MTVSSLSTVTQSRVNKLLLCFWIFPDLKIFFSILQHTETALQSYFWRYFILKKFPLLRLGALQSQN